MTGAGDSHPLHLTTKLVDFLADVTDASERDPLRDILTEEVGAPNPILWLDELPDGIRISDRSADEVLLRIQPPSLLPEPSPPPELIGWVDSGQPRGFAGPEPELLETGPASSGSWQEGSTPPDSVVEAFGSWLRDWRSWAIARERSEKRSRLYEVLESAAKTMEQRDDEYEFVLGVGLFCWRAPDGERIRRHLVTEPVLPKLDRHTAEVVVSRASGKRRFEDKEVLGGQDAYHPARGHLAKDAVIGSEDSILDDQVLADIQQWLGLVVSEAVAPAGAGVDHRAHIPEAPHLSSSPALLLRPRSRALLAETYRRIARSLREPEAQVPVGLAQLVVDTENTQRQSWLRQQGAISGDILGDDPLFPLPANNEQMRVIELLRTETGVVVQGPPGTGKTHTIANLLSALLARGQRVLVTSQKDQALQVLREKIPSELRQLCVLLAGGSKDAAKELERGLDALSEAVASTDMPALTARVDRLVAERHELRRRSAELNSKIRELRSVENIRHDAVVPIFSSECYRGTLTEIVREVKRDERLYEWMPPVKGSSPDHPPLLPDEAIELHRLLQLDSPSRRSRTGQEIPVRELFPSFGQLTQIFVSEQRARETAYADTSALTQQLAKSGVRGLEELSLLTAEIQPLLYRLGFTDDGLPSTCKAWVSRAVDDRLAGRHSGLWGQLVEVKDEPGRLQERLRDQGLGYAIELPPITPVTLGAARGWLNAGRDLRSYLEAGGKLRKRMIKPVQRDAADLLEAARVDGRAPEKISQLDVVIERLEAEVAAVQLVDKWADAGVEVPAGRVTLTLSELHDNGQLIGDVEAVTAIQLRVRKILSDSGIPSEIGSASTLMRLLLTVPAALRYIALERARSQVNSLQQVIRRWTTRHDACPEVVGLLKAVENRDLKAYERGLQSLDEARTERDNEIRRRELERALENANPALMSLLKSDLGNGDWERRLTTLRAAWAWSKASQFVQSWRKTDEERRLSVDFDQVEDRIKRVTSQLAATEAMRACLDRMTDNHARALRSYREHMGHVGAGTGLKTREFRRAARAAMEKAKDAVPAWVVPLPNLLDNILPEHNCFDVVIVDEASQVGLEQLFLLWMAPRVIVVGDDKQCTPGANRMGHLDALFESLNQHLDEVDPEIRMNFTPKSNLFGLLSSRSGKDAVVGLREHFRCMPEIINWSSSQFYGEDGRPGLVPLRERTSLDLEPLKVVRVAAAYTEGRDVKRRNPVEAKHIVEQLVRCIEDPQYVGKTFGIVVLQGTGQCKLLEHEINASITPEQRQERKIRVGSPPNFQGDERDVIFLSMVVAEAPRAQYAAVARQAFNVAASRARDQMWLFTSVGPDQLKAGDLRASLLGYMERPPSVFGKSPGLDEVSATQACEPFDSLFEQRVFREIKLRDYHVVPQHKVGSRSLDLVVVGDGGRLAVECDGHYWHTSPDQQVSDARRDRELSRMGWDVVRLRESEFELDPERELASLWDRLAERGIHPQTGPTNAGDDWVPIDLLDVDEVEEGTGDEL